jgi:hypothetical protein
MDFTFSPETAGKLVALISPFVAIIGTYLISKTDMKTWQKGAIAFAISAGFAALKTYAEGHLVANFWENLLLLFGEAQAVYFLFFKALNLERYFFPIEALVGVVTQQAKEQIADITPTAAKAVLDPNSAANVTTAVKVTA